MLFSGKGGSKNLSLICQLCTFVWSVTMKLGFDASSNGQNDTPHVRFVSVIFSVSLRLENTSEDARLPQISPTINITIK